MTPADIAALRRRLGYTLDQMAEAVGRTRETCWRWEQEPDAPMHARPSGDAMVRLYELRASARREPDAERDPQRDPDQ